MFPPLSSQRLKNRDKIGINTACKISSIYYFAVGFRPRRLPRLGCFCCGWCLTLGRARFGTVRACCPDRVAAASACAGWKDARPPRLPLILSGAGAVSVARPVFGAAVAAALSSGWSRQVSPLGCCPRSALIASADFAAVGRAADLAAFASSSGGR